MLYLGAILVDCHDFNTVWVSIHQQKYGQLECGPQLLQQEPSSIVRKTFALMGKIM